MTEARPPTLVGLFTYLSWMFLYLFGHLRDFFHSLSSSKNQTGYAPIRQDYEDFFVRRVYMRMQDCWNRPISSAPGAWINVLEREVIAEDKPMKLTDDSRYCLNLGSYNYLGFAASDAYCTPRVLETLEESGWATCSARSNAGTLRIHQCLEQSVADFLGLESSIVFGMGFATNSFVIPALIGKGCLVFSDALNHSSIVTGVRSSFAKVTIFKHNDMHHLEALLKSKISEGQPRTHRPWKKILIIVEGIYSMEGEMCHLKELVALKKKYKAYLYLDEAHSIGALGRSGRGLCEHTGVDPRDVDVMMGTFTKSFGSAGGYIAGTKKLVDYLRTKSPAYHYAASMSPVTTEQITSALKLLRGEDGSNRGIDKIRTLHQNANYFRLKMMEMGLDIMGDWDSPIIPIMMYAPAKVPMLSRECFKRHVAIVCVAFPATTLITARARICISAAHTTEDLNYGLEVMNELADMVNIRYSKSKIQKRSLLSNQSSSSLVSG